MVILQEYKNWLDYFAEKQVNMQDFQEYKYHSGTNFELDINDTIIKNCQGFFLYWQIKFDFKTAQNWSLNLSMNNCFSIHTKSIEADFLLPEMNNIFNIDHLLITPYAVFIFEAKNHKTLSKYVSIQDKWHRINENNTTTVIDNPVFQLTKYSMAVSSMMSYYNINLPVVSKVVFKNKVNLDDVSEYERNSCIYAQDIINTIYSERKNTFLPNEALKFAKILYFYGCHPAAYDDNKLMWSSKND